jgi:hypothetical protein
LPRPVFILGQKFCRANFKVFGDLSARGFTLSQGFTRVGKDREKLEKIEELLGDFERKIRRR